MKKYWVMWTYIANFSENLLEVSANSPEAAIAAATGFYRDDFKEKAKVYVFDTKPVLVVNRGIVVER